MKYFLGELFITRKRILGIYIPFYHKASTVLVEAETWHEAHEKTLLWAESWIDKAEVRGRYKYRAFTTTAI